MLQQDTLSAVRELEDEKYALAKAGRDYFNHCPDGEKVAFLETIKTFRNMMDTATKGLMKYASDHLAVTTAAGAMVILMRLAPFLFFAI